MGRPRKELTGVAAERKQMHFLLEGVDCIEWRKMLRELGGIEAEHARSALRAYMASKRLDSLSR